MTPDELARRILNRATAGKDSSTPMLKWEHFFSNCRQWDTLPAAQRLATIDTLQQVINMNAAQYGAIADDDTDYLPTPIEFQ